MKKRHISVLALSMILAASLTACGGKGGDSGSKKASGSVTESSKAGSTSETGSKQGTEGEMTEAGKIADRLLKEIKYDDEMAKMDDEMLSILFTEVPADKIKDKEIYISSSGGTSEEIACFEAVDEEGAKAIEEGLKKRVDFQKASFKNYRPEEAPRLDKAVVVRKGNFAVLSVSGDPDKAKEIIGE